MKVYEQSGYHYKSTPAIILKGLWLEEQNFEVGDYVSGSCENGKLIITPDVEKAAFVEAEAAFMEQETKKLQKEPEAEKQKSERSLLLSGKWVCRMRNGKVDLVGATKGE